MTQFIIIRLISKPSDFTKIEKLHMPVVTPETTLNGPSIPNLKFMFITLNIFSAKFIIRLSIPKPLTIHNF